MTSQLRCFSNPVVYYEIHHIDRWFDSLQPFLKILKTDISKNFSFFDFAPEFALPAYAEKFNAPVMVEPERLVPIRVRREDAPAPHVGCATTGDPWVTPFAYASSSTL